MDSGRTVPGELPSTLARTLLWAAALGSGPGAQAAALAQLPTSGSDSCATPEVLPGTGVFAFDNSSATTGPQGQGFAQCSERGAGGVAQDVWFAWTAPTTGEVLLSTCALTSLDTKVGVYDGAWMGQTCPGPWSIGLLGCSDDLSPSIRQSKFQFFATAGVQYLFQIGCFPGNPNGPPAPGGQGSFSVEYVPPSDPTPCSDDDGETDRVIGGGAGNWGRCMLGRYGRPGATAQVAAIDVVWGGAYNAAASTLVDGAPARVALWEDPTDDGDPRDCVLLEVVATTIQNHDTDVFNRVPLTNTHDVQGYYYVGALRTNPTTADPNYLPFAVDWDSLETPPSGDYQPLGRNLTWEGTRTLGPFDPTDLSDSGPNHILPVRVSVQMQGFPLFAHNLVALIRPVCVALPATTGAYTCASDTLGVDHTTSCPCGNTGAAGRGCGHSANPSGARLRAHGLPSDDNVLAPGPLPVVLACVGLPASSFTLFLQHDSPGDQTFFDGVLCAGGPLVRLRGRAAGSAQNQPPGVALFPNGSFPEDATTTLSARGGVLPGSGTVRYYAAWFRNAASSFCPPATANASNGWRITW